MKCNENKLLSRSPGERLFHIESRIKIFGYRLGPAYNSCKVHAWQHPVKNGSIQCLFLAASNRRGKHMTLAIWRSLLLTLTPPREEVLKRRPSRKSEERLVEPLLVGPWMHCVFLYSSAWFSLSPQRLSSIWLCDRQMLHAHVSIWCLSHVPAGRPQALTSIEVPCSPRWPMVGLNMPKPVVRKRFWKIIS